MQGDGDWGERTLGIFIPERNIGIAVFTNGANGQKVIHKVVSELYDNENFLAFLAFQANRSAANSLANQAERRFMHNASTFSQRHPYQEVRAVDELFRATAIKFLELPGKMRLIIVG